MTADLELILLGTSSPLHSPHRFGPSQIVRGGDTTVLIDCGWGATLRLYQAGLGPPGLPRVGAVFFNPLHSDHTTDFADFVVMRWLGGVDAPLPVYGPEGTANMVEGFRQALAADTRFRLAHPRRNLSPLPPPPPRAPPPFASRRGRGGSPVVTSGHTTPCPALINGARDADILVCDSMNVGMM